MALHVISFSLSEGRTRFLILIDIGWAEFKMERAFKGKLDNQKQSVDTMSNNIPKGCRYSYKKINAKPGEISEGFRSVTRFSDSRCDMFM